MNPESEAQPKGARHRSPNYPAFDLELAIKRAQLLYNHEKRGAVNARVATKHWGYAEKSSGGQAALAALKAFGLISDSGEGMSRTIQLTELALRILLDARPIAPERDEALKKAALMPRIYADIWKAGDSALLSDDNLRHRLVFDFRFNENTVEGFISDFKKTIRFAKLDAAEPFLDAVPRPENEGKNAATPGNGIPAERQSKPFVADIPIPDVPQSERRTMRQEVFSLSEGDVTIQWPATLSGASFEDFSDWLDILKRKVGRSVKQSERELDA